MHSLVCKLLVMKWMQTVVSLWPLHCISLTQKAARKSKGKIHSLKGRTHKVTGMELKT